jgi:hypothetical protein
VKLRGRAGNRRGVRAVPAAALALLVLSGCGELTPGTATVVNGTRITTEEVSDLAEAQCSGVALSVKMQQGQASARKKLEESALSLLMDIELNIDFGKSLDLDARPASVTAIYAQVEPLIQALPAKQRPVTEGVFHRWAEARDLMTQAGEQATGQQATPENAENLINAAYQEREPWLKKVEIDTDPRYAPNKDGFPGAGDGSVSRPTSDFAKSATATEPDAKWVSGLPANQRCG